MIDWFDFFPLRNLQVNQSHVEPATLQSTEIEKFESIKAAPAQTSENEIFPDKNEVLDFSCRLSRGLPRLTRRPQ